jgi:hypothetical protein
MGLWRKKPRADVWQHRDPFFTEPQTRDSYTMAPASDARMELREGGRYNPHPGYNEFVRRIPFDPGAPQWSYAMRGFLEYPLVAGFPQRFQFRTYQPPPITVEQGRMFSGLGQSAPGYQPPRPAAESMYTQDQIDALTNAVSEGYDY